MAPVIIILFVASLIAQLVQAVDIFPTLCSLAGLEVPKTVQGRSFAALLDEPEKTINSDVYSRFRAADATRPTGSVRCSALMRVNAACAGPRFRKRRRLVPWRSGA